MIEPENLWGIPEVVEEINVNVFLKEDSCNEKLLLILNKESGLAPYCHEFTKGFQDPQILSGFISAISSFIGEVTGKNQSHWKTVFGTDSLILVEIGDWSIGVVVASKETTEIRSKLRRIIREFEDCFKYLRDLEGIEDVFSDFDRYVRTMFVDEHITNRTVVTKIPEWRTYLSKFDLPSTAFDVSKILLGFEDSATIGQIEEFQNIGFDRIIEIISIAYWKGVVRLTYIPSDDDILDLSEKASAILFKKTNPLKLSTSCLQIVARLDGRTPLSQFFNDHMDSNKESLLLQLGSLVNNGLVQRISIERGAVLLNESLLCELVEKGSSTVGSRFMKKYFDKISIEGSTHHPRMSRILLRDDMKAICRLEESMTPDDLEDMSEALEFFIQQIIKCFSERCGSSFAKRLLEKVTNECRQKWKPYLSDVVI